MSKKTCSTVLVIFINISLFLFLKNNLSIAFFLICVLLFGLINKTEFSIRRTKANLLLAAIFFIISLTSFAVALIASKLKLGSSLWDYLIKLDYFETIVFLIMLAVSEELTGRYLLVKWFPNINKKIQNMLSIGISLVYSIPANIAVALFVGILNLSDYLKNRNLINIIINNVIFKLTFFIMIKLILS